MEVTASHDVTTPLLVSGGRVFVVYSSSATGRKFGIASTYIREARNQGVK